MRIHPFTDGRRPWLLRLVFTAFCLFTASAGLLRAQCALVCNSNLQVSLPASGQMALSPAMIAPSASATCPGTLELKLWDANGQALSGATVSCAQAGSTVTAQLRHLASGNQCSAQITVQDMLLPTLQCPAKVIFCTSEQDPGAIGMPAITDNCTPTAQMDIHYWDNAVELPCGALHNGVPVLEKIERRWFATDQSGNTGSCTETIWVRAVPLDSLVFPANRDGFAAPALVCGQNPADLALTGVPLLNGQPIDNAGPCQTGVTYSDQTISGCSPGSYTVIRVWVVLNYCTNQTRQGLQIIKVEDQTPPIISVPAPWTVNTLPDDCHATLNLPAATATDACSGVSVQAYWDFGVGLGPFSQVPEGTHVVTYQATDACGNTATATTVVTVADQHPPQMVCNTSLQVSLGINGEALVHPSALNAGCWDNCDLVFFSVSKNDSLYSGSVTLTCAEENQSVMVYLRATDISGNANYCAVPVTPRDYLKPALACPPNITLSCLQNPNDLSLTGAATAIDNCSVSYLGFVDTPNLSACQTGSIARRWTATDQSGNTRSCEQVIVMQAVSANAVQFPPDITLNGCANAPDLTPSATGTPVIQGTSCFPLSVSYTDQVFNVAAPACFRVLRRWKVIDACLYNPNGGSAGYWEHVQQISVADQSAPVLVVPPDLTVSSGATGCNAWVHLPLATATDCSAHIAISHNSPFAPPGADASGWYPPGWHQIVFSATDGCGNHTQKSVQILVRDEVAPTALCLSGLSVNLAQGGVVTLQPQWLDAGSSDQCTPKPLLQMSVTPTYFSCQHVGIQPVTLAVSDTSGNTGFCQTLVQVTDNQPFCPRFSIEGYVKTAAGNPVSGVRVNDGQGHTAVTDSTGWYQLDNLLPGLDYEIRPEKDSAWLSGLNAWDLVLISRHILNLEPLDQPEKLIAADANRSGTVTTLDISQLRKVIIGTLGAVPGNTSWRFVPAYHLYPFPDNPFEPAIPDSILIQALDAHQTGIDFTGIKIGDVDFNGQ